MYEVWVDGSVRGNPGIGGIGIAVKNNGTISNKIEKYIGDSVTNNEAEYVAVIEALKFLINNNISKSDCIIYTDSKLVYSQLTQGWKINLPHLNKLKRKADKLINKAPFVVEFRNISRWDNQLANDIAQACTEKEKNKLK